MTVLLTILYTLTGCANNCTGFEIALNSSIEEWCTVIFFGSCMQQGSFFRMATFCTGVDSAACSTACTLLGEPRVLYGWVNNTCAMPYDLDMESWKDVTMEKDKASISQWISTLIPWNWTVQAYPKATTFTSLGIQITDPSISSSDPYVSVPPSGQGTCPSSTSQKLGVFAAVNVSMALLLPIIGRRTVINRVTFGIFGTLGSQWWPVVGMISACLNVLANAINAHLIRTTPGYEDVPFGALVLLWCTRPRLAWLAVFLAAVEAEDGMYFGSAASAITSEAILQTLGSVYFGITANYGRKNKFYLLKHLDPYPRGGNAHMMYAGALLWLIMLIFTLIACFAAIVGLNEVIENAHKMMSGIERAANAVRDPVLDMEWLPKWVKSLMSRRQQGPIEAPRKLTKAEIDSIATVASASIIFVAFLAQWLFWAGFVGAARERYQ
jgi:hypothetical protein